MASPLPNVTKFLPFLLKVFFYCSDVKVRDHQSYIFEIHRHERKLSAMLLLYWALGDIFWINAYRWLNCGDTGNIYFSPNIHRIMII
jgi:hypothetical protein